MTTISVIGLQWGDEGKGKVIDLLAQDAEIVVRYQGGCNAGHTVIVGGNKYVLHQIPSGVLHPGRLCVIAHGVVVDPKRLVEEIETLEEHLDMVWRVVADRLGPEQQPVGYEALGAAEA